MRAVIVGPPAAGKSTVAIAAAARLGLGVEAVHHVDQLRWAAPHERRPRADVTALVERCVQGTAWIAEGSLGPTVNAFVSAADVVVLLDYPRRVTLVRLLRRWLRRERTGMPPGHAERPSLGTLRFAWSWHRRMRPELLTDLERLAPGRVVTLRSPRDDVVGVLARSRGPRDR